MKTLMAVTAVVVGLTFMAGTATAMMCPTLIKQGRDAAAKMDMQSDTVKKAVSMLDRAEALHKEGKHADSVKEANGALEMLGVKK
jgi:outer membrane murein-binding lipoprotein Lpp